VRVPDPKERFVIATIHDGGLRSRDHDGQRLIKGTQYVVQDHSLIGRSKEA